MTINIESIFVALGLVLTAFELRQNRKSQYIEIAQAYKERYDRMNENREEFYLCYLDKNFDLKQFEKKNHELYSKLMTLEVRFFWFLFDEWIEGHVRKSIPHYLKKDWDYATCNSMRNHVHRQAWEMKIRNMDFLGYSQFNKFINNCLKG